MPPCRVAAPLRGGSAASAICAGSSDTLGLASRAATRASEALRRFVAQLRRPVVDWIVMRRSELAFHVTMRLSEDRALARDVADLRQAARILFAQGHGRGLLAFRVADSHLHVLLAADRATAGHFARYAQSALKQRLGLPAPFEPARLRPVMQTSHLRNAVRYLFQQERHHGTDFDPAHDGSSVPDLLGMRDLGGSGTKDRLRALLPRLSLADVREWAGIVDPDTITPDESLIADAATAALGLPTLAGSGAAQNAARLGAAHASTLSARELAPHLGVTLRAVQRRRSCPADPALVRAVRLQLCHRTALRQRQRDW